MFAESRSHAERSPVKRALDLIPPRPRRKLLLLVLVQVFLGALDLLAVGLVGLVGTLAVAGFQSQTLGSDGLAGRLLQFLGLADLPVQQQVAWLAAATTVAFLGRTAASIQLMRRALHFLGARAAEVSSELSKRLLDQPLTFLQTRTQQDFIFAVTTSVNALILGALGSVVVMAADISMLIVLALLLLWASPVVATAAGILLGLLFLVLQRFTTARAHYLGMEAGRLDVESRQLLVESLSTYRDMQVRGSRDFYANRIRDSRLSSARVAAEWSFMPNVSKYVLEAAVILAAFVIGGLEFTLEDAQRAVGVLSLFLAAGMRLAPAVIRVQQGAISLKANLGQATSALALIAELTTRALRPPSSSTQFATEHHGFVPSMRCVNLHYTYPGAVRPALADFSLEIEPGQLVALVGPSGGGKSTAADLMLGVLEPDLGDIAVSGLTPAEAETRWPGAIAYVPQEVWLVEGSVRRNVALGFDDVWVPDEAIWRALEAASLADYIRGLPGRLDAQIGERGAKLSGGQRQRLGIARALLTQPKLLILDEATSALDAQTEHDITRAFHSLHGEVTTVVVAHRLAVVRAADVVVYIDDGCMRAEGSFDEVRSTVPDFAAQAALLGM